MKFEKNINILDNVSIKINDNICHFFGPKGNMSYNLHRFLSINLFDLNLKLFVNMESLGKRDFIFLPAIFNTNYINIKNCIYGVSNFFEYSLILRGIGYKASYDNNKRILTLSLGFSHPVLINIPNDIYVEVLNNLEIIVKGIDKSKVGQFAANIRALKYPDIYKGNGIRYKDENIILKIPKKAK